MKEKDFLVSIVCPLVEFGSDIRAYLLNIIQEVSSKYEQYEIILVKDKSALVKGSELNDFIKMNQGFRLLSLMQVSSVDVEITAGLESAIGDVVVVCLPPFDPPGKILEFIGVARSGSIGVGHKPKYHHETLPRKVLKAFFYRFANNTLKLGLPADTTYFVSLPRQAVTYIQRTGDRFRFLKVIAAQVGLPIQFIDYVPTEKDGRVYRSFSESVRLSVDVVTTQSLYPLRVASLACLGLSTVSMCYIVYVLNILLFKQIVQPGWGSVSIFVAFCMAVLGVVLATLCEYVAKLFNEAKIRPMYSIAEEVVSSKSVANTHIANVLNSSRHEGDR